jgi:uncharacterized membrane protein YqhA
MIPRILGSSRFLILIAVVGSYLAATTLIIYGGLNVVFISLGTLTKGRPTPEGAKELIVSSIETIDLFLLCVVLYIIASGLYRLFVGPIDIPSWLIIHNLDGLKSQLVNVIIVLLGVIFLGQVVTMHGGLDILYMGIGIGAVTFGLVYALRFGHEQHGQSVHSSSSEATEDKQEAE